MFLWKALGRTFVLAGITPKGQAGAISRVLLPTSLAKHSAPSPLPFPDPSAPAFHPIPLVLTPALFYPSLPLLDLAPGSKMLLSCFHQ